MPIHRNPTAVLKSTLTALSVPRGSPGAQHPVPEADCGKHPWGAKQSQVGTRALGRAQSRLQALPRCFPASPRYGLPFLEVPIPRARVGNRNELSSGETEAGEGWGPHSCPVPFPSLQSHGPALSPAPWPSRTSPHHKGKTSPASTQGLEHTRIAQGGVSWDKGPAAASWGQGSSECP